MGNPWKNLQFEILHNLFRLHHFHSVYTRFLLPAAIEEYSLYSTASLAWDVIVLLVFAILTGVRWNLKVILICIWLMAKDVHYFFKWFSIICSSSTENCLFKYVFHFLTVMFVFFYQILSFKYSLYKLHMYHVYLVWLLLCWCLNILFRNF